MKVPTRDEGETDGLAAFCRGEHPKLLGVLTLYTGDHDLAQELAQDVIVRVITHWRRVSGLESPGAWAHRVAINVANSSFRRRVAKRRAVERLTARPSERADVDDAADAITLRRAVAGLPTRQRTALVLRYYADLKPADVAAVMGCKEGTVWALAHQAIANLRLAPGFEAMETTDD